MNIKYRTIAMAASAALLAGSGAALATGSNSTPSPSEGAPPTTAEPQSQTVPAELSDAFAVLRGPATPGGNAAADPTSYGVNRQLLRTVQSEAAGAVRIIPGTSGVCLELDDPAGGSGGSCGTTADAKGGALSISLKAQAKENARVIVGLVPDGVDSVTISNTSIKVSNNVWSTTLASGDHTASYTDATGPRTIKVP